MPDATPFSEDVVIESEGEIRPSGRHGKGGLKSLTRVLSFSDNSLLPLLYGEYNKNLSQIEAALSLELSSKGNELAITGDEDAVTKAQIVLEELYGQAKAGPHLELGDVDGALRMAERMSALGSAATSPPAQSASGKAGPKASKTSKVSIQIRKKTLRPRSPTQADYIARLADTPMVFGIGPAGTGKTYLAVAQAVAAMLAGQVDKIILSRPAVEAGENLGFLPGDMREKVDPYLRPLYDALDDLLPADFVERRMQSGEIEIAPLAFMRGRTLSNAFIILDEAQNATVMQMKMFLTRFGENSQMVIAGDPSQVDLPPKTRSGLAHAVNTLGHVSGISIIRFRPEDVVRHPLVGRIVDAYDAADKAERGEASGAAS
ncbi:MAG: PhoH family protein [Sphingomonadales bacterium]